MAFDLGRGRQDDKDWSLGSAFDETMQSPVTWGDAVKGVGVYLGLSIAGTVAGTVGWAWLKRRRGSRPQLYDSHGRLLK